MSCLLGPPLYRYIDTERRHRSFRRVSSSEEVCRTALFQTKYHVSTFKPNTTTPEPKSLIVKTCARASLWPLNAKSLARAHVLTGGNPSKNNRVDTLFVIATFVSNNDNAQLLNLTLSGIFALHPGSDVRIVDSASPEPELIEQVVEHYQANLLYEIGDITISRDNREHAIHLPGKEIGALRDVITYIETGRSKPVPEFVVLLMHSTGLRIALPLSEMRSLYADKTCSMFPLGMTCCFSI